MDTYILAYKLFQEFIDVYMVLFIMHSDHIPDCCVTTFCSKKWHYTCTQSIHCVRWHVVHVMVGHYTHWLPERNPNRCAMAFRNSKSKVLLQLALLMITSTMLFLMLLTMVDNPLVVLTMLMVGTNSSLPWVEVQYWLARLTGQICYWRG